MSNQTVDTLNSHFAVPNMVRFEAGNGGLVRAVLSAKGSQAHIYLHGAHITHFVKTNEKPLLFMSTQSQFEANKPIRGGVPICFPWFGPKADDPKAPAHGFARLREWTVESVGTTPVGEAQLTLSLKSDEQTLKLWPNAFAAKFILTVGAALKFSLTVNNIGTSALQYDEALHTYFGVGDVKQINVTGLEGVTYYDKANGMKRVTQQGPITITEETDRIYLNTQSTCVLTDPVNKRKIHVAKSGSNTTVVWNPWIAKAKAMVDFGDDEWPGMLCVETCNNSEYPVKLGVGESHTTSVTISSAV